MKNSKQSISSQKEVLIPYRKGSLWGFCNSNNEVIISCQYNEVTFFHDDIAWVNLKNKWGTIDVEGKEITPCIYTFNEPIQNILSTIYENVILAYTNNKYRLIEYSGKEICSFDYTDAGTFQNGIARVAINSLWGFVNTQGIEIAPCKYEEVGDFSEGLAKVYSSKWGYINIKGQEVVATKYEDAGDFSEGLAYVSIESKFLWLSTNLYGYIDTAGKEVIPFKYHAADNFTFGLAQVKNKTRSGVIDKSGKIRFPFKYSDFKILSSDLYLSEDEDWSLFDSTGKLIDAFSSSLELGEVKSGVVAIGEYLTDFSRSGIIDIKRKTLTDLSRYTIHNISEGFISIQSNSDELCGFTNLNGKIVIPCKYNYTGDFHDSMAIIRKVEDGKFGYIDTSDWETIMCKYDEANDFFNGFALVTIDDKFGYIDKKGTEYWENE